MLPPERYRVEKYLVSDPADVDGDCIDDITELDNLGSMNPVNPADALESNDGAVAIPDRATFEVLSLLEPYFNPDTPDPRLTKYVLVGLESDNPRVYFMNINRHLSHLPFVRDILPEDQTSGVNILGGIVYFPELLAPNGSPGVYGFLMNFSPGLGLANLVHTLLAASMPFLKDQLVLYIPNALLPPFQDDVALYRTSFRLNPVFDEDFYPQTTFLALNPAEGYGRLQVLEPDDRPQPRDIVLYEALPNELPRVAGIITTVRQTRLSHVNQRAVQAGIPNAFIRDAHEDPAIAPLIGSFVRYEVTEDGYSIRAATPAEVDAHYEASRPAQSQTPQRDLLVTQIMPLSDIGFEDWGVFGVEAANVAVLGTLGFPEGTVPDGFAIPFYFYDEFMKAHGFYDAVGEMLANEDFQTDFEVQDDMLDDLRDDIKDAESPQGIIDALTAMHATYPEGQSLRYRSSTNNEDLPGFNGAGLYDSETQDPEKTAEDGIDKSFKEVLASLWTFRAFTEREFHRIDHRAAAMGVLVHPNYTEELANGVATSFDPFYGSDKYYYVNSQFGEEQVTNPEAYSLPEELRLGTNGYDVRATSNLVEPGELLLSDAQLRQLRQHLEVIHDHFKGLYDPAPGEPFALEVEFKITSENVLAIKQARPWVFDTVQAPPPPPPPPSRPPGSTGGGSSGGGSSGGGGGGGGSRPADDHGNSPAQATEVTPGASAPWASFTPGQLNTASDEDYFTLTLPQAGVLVVETTGSTDTVGTVWQDGEELASAASGGVRRNFRLGVPVEAGSVVIAVASTGGRTGAYTVETTLLVGYLENPGPASFQSGVGVISGWVCAADAVEIALNGAVYAAAYGTERLDTLAACGDTANGFGVLFNWSRLGDGEHEVVAYVDAIELGRATVTVTTLGAEFVRGVAGACTVPDFPMTGETVTLVWQESKQNFVLAEGAVPSGENRAGTAGVGYLENPSPHSFQSGIGVISGWVCAAETVAIAIGTLAPQEAGYGTERLDTQAACGDTDNGFGLLFNWNRLGDGEHTVIAAVDNVELGRATVRVTTLGAEFVRGAVGECVVEDFPMLGERVTLEWQQNSQNFAITAIN